VSGYFIYPWDLLQVRHMAARRRIRRRRG